MKEDSIIQAYKDAKAKLAGLITEREELDRQIARLKQYIVSVEPFVAEQRDIERVTNRLYPPDAGLKAMCLEALTAAYVPLTPAEIVARFKEMQFDIDKYSNPLAVVTTTLKRLVESGEAEEVEKDGKKAYQIKRAGLFSRFARPAGAFKMPERDTNTQTDLKPRRLSGPPTISKRLGKKD